MRLQLGTVTRYVEGREVEATDEALIFIDDVEPDDEGDASIHIRCKNAKAVAERIIQATR